MKLDPILSAARSVRALGVSLLPLLCSCSLMLNPSDAQCESNDDCTARGFQSATCVNQACQPSTADSPWGCLGNVHWSTGAAREVSLSVMVVDVMTSGPPADLHIQACAKLDVSCATPLPATFSSDAQGRVVAKVGAGFEGYLEFTSPTITPALFFVVRPVWEDTVVPNVLPVVSPQGFEGIAQAIGTTLDLATMGHAYALGSDCLEVPAEGVRLEIDKENSSTARYYMINQVPVGTAPATDASGSGGFLNLEPGFTKITGYVSSTGARVGEAGFVVRAGAVSYPRVLPTP